MGNKIISKILYLCRSAINDYNRGASDRKPTPQTAPQLTPTTPPQSPGFLQPSEASGLYTQDATSKDDFLRTPYASTSMVTSPRTHLRGGDDNPQPPRAPLQHVIDSSDSELSELCVPTRESRRPTPRASAEAAQEVPEQDLFGREQMYAGDAAAGLTARYSWEPPEKDSGPEVPMRGYHAKKEPERRREEAGPHRAPQYPERYNYLPESTASSSISMESAHNILGRGPKKVVNKYATLDDGCKRGPHKDYYLGDRSKPMPRQRSPGKSPKPMCRSKSNENFYPGCPMCANGERAGYCPCSPCSSRRRSPPRPSTQPRQADYDYGEPSNRHHYRCPPSQPSSNDTYNDPYGQAQYCQYNRFEGHDDHLSFQSNTTDNSMQLAYQNFDEYPDLVHELENTLSHRNKDRVRKTMREFEIRSRQNKNLEKPIIYDEEMVATAGPSHDKHHRKGKRRQEHHHHHHREEYRAGRGRHSSPSHGNDGPRGDAAEMMNAASMQQQNFEEDPLLVQALANTISKRNKDRVMRTIRQFEIMSRQNKNLERPVLYYDEEKDNLPQLHIQLVQEVAVQVAIREEAEKEDAVVTKQSKKDNNKHSCPSQTEDRQERVNVKCGPSVELRWDDKSTSEGKD